MTSFLHIGFVSIYLLLLITMMRLCGGGVLKFGIDCRGCVAISADPKSLLSMVLVFVLFLQPDFRNSGDSIYDV